VTGLFAALIAFVGTHFLMSHPLRAPMVKAMGTAVFQIVYSLVSFATFAWVYFAFMAAPRGDDLWSLGEAGWTITSALTLISAILFVGSVGGNPALPRPDAATLAARPARGVLAITRHPMMWSFAIWALGHAIVAPYPASLLLVGSMAFLALAGSAGQDIKKAKLMGDSWRDWSSRTSFWPFGAQVKGVAIWRATWPGRTPILGGIALWLIATWAHPYLGAPVVGIWQVMAG
jgi:uncharacterized membrane protein